MQAIVASSLLCLTCIHVQVSGLPRDQSAYTTRALDNNNIDPYWHETARFAVTCPPTAMIEFLVNYTRHMLTHDVISPPVPGPG